MRKIIAILASLSILACGTTVMLANESEQNPTAAPTGAPTATPAPTLDPDDHGSKRTGSGGAGITAEEATVAVKSDTATLAEDVAGAVVTEQALNADDKAAVENILGGDDVEYATFTLDASEDEKLAFNSASDNRKLIVTVPTELSAGDNVKVVVNYGDGWVTVSPEYVTINEDGTVTLTLDGYGEVSFWVNSDVADAATAPVVTSVSSSYTSSNGSVAEIPAKAISAQAAPSKATDYTVVNDVDYTVVSPQTGYAETWVFKY